MLAEAAPDAAEALQELLYDGDPIQRYKASTAILDRTGMGPIQRRAVKQRVELDPATADLLKEALGEVHAARRKMVDVTPRPTETRRPLRAEER